DAGRFGMVVRDTSSALAGASVCPADLIQRVEQEARDMAARSDSLSYHLAEAAERITMLESSLDDVRRDAVTDGLTGLHNRRAFDARLRDLAYEAAKFGAPLCLLLLDIDHFKRINDSFGHQIGDEV